MYESILRMPTVMSRTALSRSTIYDKLNPKSPRHDPSFPKPVSLGARAIGFVESEVTAWIAAQIEQSRAANS